MDKFLNMLVVFINDSIRYCKVSLETEEKSKDIAFLQGKITGYRLLLSFLKKNFNLEDSFLEDNGESPVVILELPREEIDKLSLVIESLLVSNEWEGVLGDVTLTKEGLKAFLLDNAENARDLYVSQAQYMAITCYESLFNSVKKAEANYKEELPFSGGAIEEPEDVSA
jgi:hypothetical protein